MTIERRSQATAFRPSGRIVFTGGYARADAAEKCGLEGQLSTQRPKSIDSNWFLLTQTRLIMSAILVSAGICPNRVSPQIV